MAVILNGVCVARAQWIIFLGMVSQVLKLAGDATPSVEGITPLSQRNDVAICFIFFAYDSGEYRIYV